VVYGRPDEDDQIMQPAYATLASDAVTSGGDDPPHTPPDPGGTHPPRPPLAPPETVRYSGEVSLDRPGPFGYTVRVLPWHPLLDSRAELGLVTYPQAPPGMTNGDLR
jgi:glycogen phosphorylase